MAHAAKRKSKKAKPSFDVARADIAEGSSGWVYRSEVRSDEFVQDPDNLKPASDAERVSPAEIALQMATDIIPAVEATAQVAPELVPAAEHLVGPADQPSAVLTTNALAGTSELATPVEPPVEAPYEPLPPFVMPVQDEPRYEDVRGSASQEIGWIESGVNVMVMPLTIAIVAMIAPVMWMLGPRAHR
jgi:hypothetical protein